MCLTRVDNVYDKPIIKKMIGYKVFESFQTRPHRVRSMIYSHVYDAGEWYESYPGVGESPDILADDGIRYPAGFHVYRSISGTRQWYGVVYKVEYNRVVACGFDGYKCDIALDMRIVKKISKG